MSGTKVTIAAAQTGPVLSDDIAGGVRAACAMNEEGAGWGAEIMRQPVVGRKVALSLDFGGIVPLDREVTQRSPAAAARFEALDCSVEEVVFDACDLVEIIAGTRSFGMVARYAERYDRRKDLMIQQLRFQVEAALQMDVRSIGAS